MKPKIFIDGEHGTTGLQIRSRLARRDDLDVISIPEAERRNDQLRLERLNEADIAILCLPDAASKEAIGMLEGSNSTRIIDTSTAHRIHPDWAYGFAEMDRDQTRKIADARFVANPGCYPTGAIALIRPLRLNGVMPSDYPVTINAVSGYTGGGKQMIAQIEDEDHPDHIPSQHFLYGLGLKHKHVPEIRQYGLLDREPLFSPSVSRFAQGMIVQVPLHLDMLNGQPSLQDLHAILSEHYADQQVVEVVPLEESRQLDRICAQGLADTNGMRLFVLGQPDGAHVNLVAQLDNLGKGASGAAVQNMNLMLAS